MQARGDNGLRATRLDEFGPDLGNGPPARGSCGVECRELGQPGVAGYRGEGVTGAGGMDVRPGIPCLVQQAAELGDGLFCSSGASSLASSSTG